MSNMDRLNEFWNRFSLANGSGVALVLNRNHSYKDDILYLRSTLINVMLDSGEYTDVYWLCNLSEQYGRTIDINPHFEITQYMTMVYNMLKAELHLPFEFKGNQRYDELFKAFVGLSVLTHAVELLRKRGWKRFCISDLVGLPNKSTRFNQ